MFLVNVDYDKESRFSLRFKKNDKVCKDKETNKRGKQQHNNSNCYVGSVGSVESILANDALWAQIY